MDDSKQCGQGITAAGSIPSALPLKMLKWTGREILDPNFFDFVALNETKLDDCIPQSFFRHPNYNSTRRDRNGNGGGVLIFIKNNYIVTKTEIGLDFETIFAQLKIENSLYNFISGYKPPSESDKLFVEHLENL